MIPLTVPETGRLLSRPPRPGGWVRRTQRRRVVQVTDLGQEKLPEVLGLPAGWAQPATGDAWLSRRAAS